MPNEHQKETDDKWDTNTQFRPITKTGLGFSATTSDATLNYYLRFGLVYLFWFGFWYNLASNVLHLAPTRELFEYVDTPKPMFMQICSSACPGPPHRGRTRTLTMGRKDERDKMYMWAQLSNIPPRAADQRHLAPLIKISSRQRKDLIIYLFYF